MLAQLKVAIADLLLMDSIELYLLPEYEQQFLAPVSFQAFGDIPGGRFDLGSRQRCQRLEIAFSLQDGPDDLHAAHPADVAQHVAELHVHLCQYLLHALNRAARLRHQIASLSPQGTRDSDLVGRLEAVTQ
jgi:hypothetical protein